MRGAGFGVVVLVVMSSVLNTASTAVGAAPTFGFAHVVREFGVSGISSLANWTEVRDVEELPDGALLLRVTRPDSTGFGVEDGLVRLRADGSIDPTFAASGSTPGELTLPSGAGTHLLVRTDGRVHLSDGIVLQYTAAGEPDLTFGNSGRAFSSVGGPAFELADGFVLHPAPQQAALGGLSLQVFSPTGVQDVSRLVFTGLETRMLVALEKPDGAHVVVAYDSPLVSEPGHILAIRSDGRFDTGFGGGDGIAPLEFEANSPTPGLLLDAALQADGRMVMLFYASSVNRVRVMRFNADGSRDPSFGSGGHTDVDGVAGSVVTQPDGRIDLVLSYRFEDPPVENDHPDKTFVIRLLPDGEIDPSFNVNGLAVGSVTLGELGVSDRSFAARGLRLRQGDVLIARTQISGQASSLQLVRIAFDTASYPLPIATRLEGPAGSDVLVQARRLGFVSDS